jgi:hypothetical protein
MDAKDKKPTIANTAEMWTTIQVMTDSFAAFQKSPNSPMLSPDKMQDLKNQVEASSDKSKRLDLTDDLQAKVERFVSFANNPAKI